MGIDAAIQSGRVVVALLVGAHLGPHVHIGAGGLGILAAAWLGFMAVVGGSATLLWALLGIVLVVSAAALVMGWYGLSRLGTVEYRGDRLEAAEGLAVGDLAPDGLVRVRGEQWNATSVNGIARAGTRVQVLRRSGVRLEVWAEHPDVQAAGRDVGGYEEGSTWS